MTVHDIQINQNTDERSFVRDFVEDGLSLYTGLNEYKNETGTVQCQVPARIIQFYFCLKGQLEFNFSPFYKKQLQSGNYFFMYNPKKNLNFDIIPNLSSKWVAAYTTADKPPYPLIFDQNEALKLQAVYLLQKSFEMRGLNR